MSRDSAWRDIENLDDRLEEIYEDHTAEEIAEAARAEGIDTKADAARVREIFVQAYKHVTQRKLREAQAAYESADQNRARSNYDDLPTTHAGRLSLLVMVQAQTPEVLLGYRDFQGLDPADLESLVQELKDLGVFDSLSSSDGPEG